MSDEFAGPRALLVQAMIASCTCGVKSPDSHWHDADCRWRTLCELSDALDIAADASTRLLRERDAALAETAALRERVGRLDAIIKRIPSALNSHFSAGAEEREYGSGRRQAKLMEAGERLAAEARAALEGDRP